MSTHKIDFPGKIFIWIPISHVMAHFFFFFLKYDGSCPKISYTKVADQTAYANSADPDQTAPEGAV